MQATSPTLDLVANREPTIGRAYDLDLAIVATHLVGVLTEASSLLNAPTGQPAQTSTGKRPQRPSRRTTDHHNGQHANGLSGGIVMGLT